MPRVGERISATMGRLLAEVMGSSRLRPRLFFELLAERLFSLGNIALVTIRINEGICCARLHPGELRLHSVVVAVRAKEDITRQAFQDLEAAFVVLGNLRILRVAYQLVSGINVRAATITTSYDLPPSLTFVVHVVVPLV